MHGNRFLKGIAGACLVLCMAQADAFDLGDLLDKGQIGIAQNPTGTSKAKGLAGFSNEDQIASLRQALSQGIQTSVASLSRSNGYFGNPEVKIPLPESLQNPEGLMRRFGMGSYADDLILALNRAAEAAAPQAKTILLNALKKMSVNDAKGILTGGNDAATQYFRKNTEASLTGKFKPVVDKAMAKVNLAQKYDRFAGKGAQFGLVDARDAKLSDYVTRKALDGLFLMMAQQEKSIRANPLEATGDLAKKVFSAIKSPN